MSHFNSNLWLRNRYLLSGLVLVCLYGAGNAWAGSELKTLSFDEEQQIRDQAQSNGLSKAEEIELQQKWFDCKKESEQRRNWHFGDYLTDSIIGDDSKCTSQFQNKGNGSIMRERGASTDAIIDKQLNDALEKARLEKAQKAALEKARK